MSPDEARWIAQARDGDGRAFQRLVEAHARPLFRLCARITRDEAVAEDAVQEALLSAFRHLKEFDGRAQFSTWLHRIGVNSALQELRKRGRHTTEPVHDDDDEAPYAHVSDEAPGPERAALARDTGRAIAEQLGRMSTLERTAFVLRHHEGRSIAEICDVLSLNDSACKQAIFRAVKKLRAALEVPA